MNFFPLCTARVWPTNSGRMVDLRDHVFRIFLSPDVFMASIFLLRLASTKGPFLTDLGTAPSVYLLLVLLEIISLVVFLFFLVLTPSGSPHGEQPGRPPEDFPSPPPSGWSTGFMTTPRTRGRLPIQRA